MNFDLGSMIVCETAVDVALLLEGCQRTTKIITRMMMMMMMAMINAVCVIV